VITLQRRRRWEWRQKELSRSRRMIRTRSTSSTRASRAPGARAYSGTNSTTGTWSCSAGAFSTGSRTGSCNRSPRGRCCWCDGRSNRGLWWSDRRFRLWRCWNRGRWWDDRFYCIRRGRFELHVLEPLT
jgi:hypothetical protein